MRHVTLLTALTVLLSLASHGVAAQDAPKLPFDPSKKAADGTDLNKLEREFQAALSGSTLVGSFTINGKEGPGALRKERYTISQVSKVANDVWRFDARVQYGKVDVTVPMPLYVKWAGDTAVIQLTNMKIPGLGEAFTARVLIYRDEYAGTWAHGRVGGQMFGKIERPKRDSTE